MTVTSDQVHPRPRRDATKPHAWKGSKDPEARSLRRIEACHGRKTAQWNLRIISISKSFNQGHPRPRHDTKKSIVDWSRPTRKEKYGKEFKKTKYEEKNGRSAGKEVGREWCLAGRISRRYGLWIDLDRHGIPKNYGDLVQEQPSTNTPLTLWI